MALLQCMDLFCTTVQDHHHHHQTCVSYYDGMECPPHNTIRELPPHSLSRDGRGPAGAQKLITIHGSGGVGVKAQNRGEAPNGGAWGCECVVSIITF